MARIIVHIKSRVANNSTIAIRIMRAYSTVFSTIDITLFMAPPAMEEIE
jgi:hypothetical protein